ncbi:MAG: pre-peptidase C-terminal domain-containing protein, partial [Deltaproteobacteria bacterium]
MFEPNGDFHQAKLLTASPVEAYLFPSGDYDFYKFYAEAGKTVQIKADNMPANLRLRLELHDGNNEYLWISKEATTAGQAVSMEYPITVSGYYFVRINGLEGTFSADGPYRLSITDAKLDYIPSGQVRLIENEPNGDFRSATQIGIGAQAVTGSFAAANDSDWFRFEVTQQGRLTISLTVPSLITSEIRLYDANRTEQASRYAENKGDSSQLVFDISKPGTWYLWIHAKDGVTSTDNYQISLSLKSAPDLFEPNADYSDAKLLAFAQPVQPFIFPVGDRDWFKIKTEEPGLIRFMIQNVPPNLKIKLVLYNENKDTLLTKDILNAGDPLEAVYLAPVAGTYYFQVSDREDSRDSTAPYKLTVFFTPMVDSAEPNNSFGYPTILEASNQVNGLIYPNGDYDWYRFFVKDAGTLRIQMAQTNGIEAHIQLYTDSKQWIAGKIAKNKGDTVELTYQITKPDFYYLAVNDEGDNDHSLEPYILTIAGADFKQFYPLASIRSISPNPAVLGTRVTLTGSGAGQDGGAIAGYEWSSDKDGVIGRTAAIDLTDLSAGTHQIGFKVQDQQGNWSATVYRYLDIASSINEESEYNNAFASANPVPLRQWVRGRIYPQEDVDLYKIYVDRPGNLSVRLAAVPDGMKGRVEFYNEKGDYLWRADGAINSGDWIDYRFFADQGWYYAKIYDQNGQGYSGTYAVFFDLLAAQDRYEPNNSFSQATQITIDSLVTDGFIGKEGDLDWYQINLPQKGRLGLSLKHADMRGRIEIYNADYGYLWVANEGYHGGDNVFLNFNVDLTGIYYIRINDADGKAYTTPYAFENTFTPVNDPYEENDTIGAATLLPASGVVDAFVFPAGDLDWFKIYATAGQQLSFAVTNVPPEMKAIIQIYNQNLDYSWVSEGGNNPGDAVYLTYTVPKAGFTYIRINDERGLSYATAYRLTVGGGSPAYDPQLTPSTVEQEPNDDYGSAGYLALDTDVKGKIDPANDTDRYRFYINSPGIVTISHTHVTGGVTSEMWVYSADGSQLYNGYHTTTEPDKDNVLTLTLEKAGYYWVRLADRGQDNVSTSEYTLRVTHTPVVDAGEPNNNNGTATRLGQNTIQGYIFDPADQDWYRIYVRQPGNLVVSLDTMPANIRPHVRLYNADKTQVGEWLATNAGDTGDITYTVVTPGFYFVQIYHEGSDSYSASPYTLRITGADFTHT